LFGVVQLASATKRATDGLANNVHLALWAIVVVVVAAVVGQQSGNAFQPAYNVALLVFLPFWLRSFLAVVVVVTLLVATYVQLPLAVGCGSEREGRRFRGGGGCAGGGG